MHHLRTSPPSVSDPNPLASVQHVASDLAHDSSPDINKEQKNSPCKQMNDPKTCNTLAPNEAAQGRPWKTKQLNQQEKQGDMHCGDKKERERETKAHGVARLSRIYQSQSYRCCRCCRFPLSGLGVRILSLFSAVGGAPSLPPHSRREAAVDTFMQWVHGEYVQSVALSGIMRPLYSLDA
ncbi:hypothetical protein BHE74_00041618 [Ensete ventricosum]|nr:hypothetical protein BHE74_00041618 [Ensete ventricosum]